MSNYYEINELKQIGFLKVGEDVLVSKKSSIYGAGAISLGSHIRIDDFTFISGGSGVTIDDYVHVASYTALYGKHGIHIGKYVNLSSRVSVYSTSDDYSGGYLTGPMVDEKFIHDIGQEIVIKDHVIVGCGSVLLPGAYLDEGCAIGAMSLVKVKIPAFTMYAGVPAKFIKDRKRDMLDFLN